VLMGSSASKGLIELTMLMLAVDVVVVAVLVVPCLRRKDRSMDQVIDDAVAVVGAEGIR